MIIILFFNKLFVNMSNVEQLVEAVLLMSALPDSAVSDTFFDVQTQKMQ